MSDARLSPLASLGAFLAAVAGGRVTFPRDRLNQTLTIEGEDWLIFREMIVQPRPGQPALPAAVFRPRFRLAGMGFRANRLVSLLAIPFFSGLPGFRSKLWLYRPADGAYSGWYEWDSAEDARAYGTSFAARFMTRRAVPGSVSFSVLPNPRAHSS